MPLIDPQRVIQNVITLIILLVFGFLVYSKLNKEQLKATIESIKGLFGGKKDGG